MIIGSSIMLGTAHWWPDYVCWLVYLFLTPLFYAGLSNIPIGCRHGFCWGLVFFGMQLWATTELLEHYSTPFYYCIVVAAYIYSVCHAAIWFYSAALFAHSRGVILRCIVWILSTHGFFWFLYRHGLWIIDYNLGYFGALFWLPLAVHIRAVRPIYYMGISLFSLAIIAWSMLLALWLHKRQVWILCILVSMCTLYCILIIIPPTIPRVQPPWLSHACWIPYDYMRKEHPYDRAQAIAHRITRAQQANEQLSIFILPESACQFALNDHQHLIGWWYSQLHDDTWILCGGYRRNNSDENLIYNTLYVTHNAHPITHYDKKTLVPFFEYQPTHTACNLSVKTPFFAPSCQPSHCLVTPWCTFIPMICSELFLVTHNRVKNSDIARLCLVHDGWFTRNHYMQQLMELYAHVRALVEYSPYLYISHTYGLYIDGEHKVSL
jgi:apolipoprotein N-acyltransferase